MPATPALMWPPSQQTDLGIDTMAQRKKERNKPTQDTQQDSLGNEAASTLKTWEGVSKEYPVSWAGLGGC